MVTKSEILEAIRQTTKDNRGKTLGTARFEKETGIKSYDWGKYWPRFGDALKEAGFSPNNCPGVPIYADEFLLEKIVGLVRKLGRFPTYREIRCEKINDSELPDNEAFYRFGKQKQFASRVMEYCHGKSGYEDVLKPCRNVLGKNAENEVDAGTEIKIGEVYLFKSGRYYKIGKTYDSVRRGSEIRIQLPEKLDLIHSIRTDDPSGIEAYWHKRFESKRMQGEWFDLNISDVKAFKRWRRIV